MLPQLFIPLWGYISAVCLFQGVSHGLNMLVPLGHIIVPSSIMPYTTGSCHWITLVPLLFPAVHSNLSLAYLPLAKIDGKKKRNRELLSCMLTPCISLVEECVMITLSSPGHYCWTVWLDLMSRINKENCVSKPSKRKVLSLTSSLSKREKTVQTVQNTKSKTKTKPGKHKVSQRFAGQGQDLCCCCQLLAEEGFLEGFLKWPMNQSLAATSQPAQNG